MILYHVILYDIPVHNLIIYYVICLYMYNNVSNPQVSEGFARLRCLQLLRFLQQILRFSLPNTPRNVPVT